MTNQELSAMIAEEVRKAVTPLYERIENISSKADILTEEPKPAPSEEQEPDFTETAKYLKEIGLLK